MTHDRIHAQRPHDPERFRVGRIVSMTERDGHCVVTVEPVSNTEGNDGKAEGGSSTTDTAEGSSTADTGSSERIELVVTFAVRDLFVSRLSIDDDESPVGERVWFREYGGRS